MPRYDFKCTNCGKIEEKNMPYKDAIKGFACENCNGLMVKQFTASISLICKWRPPYKKGHNAKKDRYEAFKGLQEKGKLPKSITPQNAHVDNLADLR